MSMSPEGYRDLFWQGYPQLRRLLEGKENSIRGGVEGLMVSAFPEDQRLPSTWQGSLDRLADFLCIAQLVGAYGRDLQDAIAAGTSPAEQILEEINRLLDELEGRTQGFLRAFAHSFDRDIRATRTLAHDVDALYCRLRSEEVARRAEKQAQHQDTIAEEET